MPYHDINETHDPKLESWVESANDPETDFPIQNLPLCTCLFENGDEASTAVGVVIGDFVLNLNQLAMSDLVDEDDDDWAFFGLDVIIRDGTWPKLRREVSRLLHSGNPALHDHAERDDMLIPRSQAKYSLWPLTIPDYTDFYASVHHATNVGSMFRPDNPLLPNYKWLPVGYHGRASTIVPSGTPVRRPAGQQAPAEDGGQPGFGPCKMLDYEMELGFFVGRGNTHGQPVPIDQAEDHIFGMCIVNDWSARDIQKWEYQPLGPFLAKSFATTISPYIVTMEALAPFRCPALKRPDTDPRPLPHLYSEADQTRGGIDITVEVWLQSEEMHRRGMSPVRLSQGNFNQMYWTISQMLAHHTSNGCLVQPGDLMASGTISGPKRENRGCLLELTWNGDPFATPPKVAPTTDRTPIEFPTGEKRRFLEDGDEVIMKAYCQRDGFRRIGFGECRGKIAPATT